MIKPCLLLLPVISGRAPRAVQQPAPDNLQGEANKRKGAASPAKAAVQTPAGGAGAFAAKRYRNPFLEAGHSQKEISQKISAAFQQLFHGDPDTQAVYYPVGRNANGPLAYLSDINNKDVRSEGMSYGMMIAVQVDKKAEFDALWNWSKTFMYQRASNSAFLS